MAATLGTHGSASFGGDELPRPATVVMAYTGHAEFSENDPPTFVTVSADDLAKLFANLPKQDFFLESMADACKAVIDSKGRENFLYINVANRLSIDCDCDSKPHEPAMADLGIFASADPVALDQAGYDAVVNSPDPGKAALVERMNALHGIRTVEAANELGLGSRRYTIVSLG